MSAVAPLMPRVVLIHWKPPEAQTHAARLRDAGLDVDVIAPKDGRAVRALGERPPHAFLIDLSRLPSQGLAVGIELRKTAATRRVPLIFISADDERTEKAHRVLPDAAFLSWPELPASLEDAVRAAPQKPAGPDAMAGYSGTPLVKKLGIRAQTCVALLGAPDGFEAKLAPLPDGVRLHNKARTADRVLLFADSVSALERRFHSAAKAVAAGGGLWIVWPKKTSGVTTDLTETIVRKFGLAENWVDYKICAVDQTWSGLQFARRRK